MGTAPPAARAASEDGSGGRLPDQMRQDAGRHAGQHAEQELTADSKPPTVVKLPQTGFYVGAMDVPAPTVEHVYVLADALDDTPVYQYQQPPAPEATD